LGAFSVSDHVDVPVTGVVELEMVLQVTYVAVGAGEQFKNLE
jgi:hypothetical protein